MHVRICVYAYMRICMYVRMYVCMHARMHACVCMHVCVYVWVHVCMYACMQLWLLLLGQEEHQEQWCVIHVGVRECLQQRSAVSPWSRYLPNVLHVRGCLRILKLTQSLLMSLCLLPQLVACSTSLARALASLACVSA